MRFLLDDHDTVSDVGMAEELALDFPQFNTEATDLDLIIHASQVFDVIGTVLGIGEPACQVARPIQAAAGLKWVREEALGCKPRPIQIPATHPGAAHVHLTRTADRRGMAVAVENVDGQVRERPADIARGLLGIGCVTSLHVTCTVVSVMPYILMS